MIIGGPGQGKSTLGQFLCQIYRTSILVDRLDKLIPEAASIIKQLEIQRSKNNSELPKVRRFPIRIELNRYATKLANNPSLTLINYIKEELSRLGNIECDLANIRHWLKFYPWLLVLDGLDEVPQSSNRKQVLEEIQNFRVDVANLNSDVFIVITTRPQNYSGEFNKKEYRHLYLLPLTAEYALRYARQLLETRYGSDRDRQEQIFHRLEKACTVQATARLMQSPLQVTVMTRLVEASGEPPSQRYRLFQQYYQTFYNREIERGIQSSSLLNDRKTDIDFIHYRAGLLLQARSEQEGNTEAILTNDDFQILVKHRLNEIEFTGNKADVLLKQITDVTIQRLVFLIRRQENEVSFEIRSLQEYAAAEALLKGSEEFVKKRFREIAPYFSLA